MTRGKATVRRASNETSIFVDLDLGGKGRVEAKGDETHHVAEDVAHTVGRALRKALPAAGVARFGEALVPMDEALVQVAVDLVDRPYYRSDLPASSMAEHVLRSLVSEARLTFHEVTLRPGEDHP